MTTGAVGVSLSEAGDSTSVGAEIIANETTKRNLQYLALHYHEALTFISKQKKQLRELAFNYYFGLHHDEEVALHHTDTFMDAVFYGKRGKNA